MPEIEPGKGIRLPCAAVCYEQTPRDREVRAGYKPVHLPTSLPPPPCHHVAARQ
jgi:hypothetical protein